MLKGTVASQDCLRILIKTPACSPPLSCQEATVVNPALHAQPRHVPSQPQISAKNRDPAEDVTKPFGNVAWPRQETGRPGAARKPVASKNAGNAAQISRTTSKGKVTACQQVSARPIDFQSRVSGSAVS